MEVFGLKVALAAMVVVVIPEVLNLLLLYILVPDVSPLVQLGVLGVIKLALQFVVMFVTFTMLKQKEDEIVSWWLYLIIGIVISLFVIPGLVQQLFGFF